MQRDERLHEALLDAHSLNDHKSLVYLYMQAADAEQDRDDVDAECYFLTHAYIYALESGLSEHSELNARLQKHGRI